MMGQKVKRLRLAALALLALGLSSWLALTFFGQFEFSRAKAGAARVSVQPEMVNYSALAIAQAAKQNEPGQLFFKETGHYLANGFLNYWRINNGPEQFGQPISEEISEAGLTVQYFEKARFEWHEEWRGTIYEVSLGRLGHEFLESDETVPVQATAYLSPNQALAGTRYFAETGHTIAGKWRDKWEREGGLTRFGFPLTEQFNRIIDGVKYTAQIFERVELRLKNNSDNLELAGLGYNIAAIKQSDTKALEYDKKATLYGPNIYEHWVDINLSTQTARFMEGDLVIRSNLVTTGKRGHETPTGTFYILRRVYNETMVGGQLGTEDYYNLSNVLYTQYFTDRGHALHYAWWRSQFGVTGSHGCINEDLATARFAWQFLNFGSRVNIHY